MSCSHFWLFPTLFLLGCVLDASGAGSLAGEGPAPKADAASGGRVDSGPTSRSDGGDALRGTGPTNKPAAGPQGKLDARVGAASNDGTVPTDLREYGHDADVASDAAASDASADAAAATDADAATAADPATDAAAADADDADAAATDAATAADAAADAAAADAAADDAADADADADDADDADADDVATYPASCVALPNGGNGLDVTLYWDGDKAKPYDAHCGPGGATYVRLNDNSGKNASTYPLGSLGCTSLVVGQNQSVTTTWTMLRFDPVTHVVDTSDFAGATSVGGTHEISGDGQVAIDYLKVPFASGRVCDGIGGASSVATVDLSKTKLAVVATQTWSQDGFRGVATVSADGHNKKLTLKLAGYPAGVSPCASGFDYYTQAGGKCLTLAYAP